MFFVFRGYQNVTVGKLVMFICWKLCFISLWKIHWTSVLYKTTRNLKTNKLKLQIVIISRNSNSLMQKLFFSKLNVKLEICQAIQEGGNYNSTNNLAPNRVTIRTHAEVLAGEDRRTYHNTNHKWIFWEWYRYGRVRNTGMEYAYGKEFAGLCTGTGYFRKTEYGINSGADSFWIL